MPTVEVHRARGSQGGLESDGPRHSGTQCRSSRRRGAGADRRGVHGGAFGFLARPELVMSPPAGAGHSRYQHSAERPHPARQRPRPDPRSLVRGSLCSLTHALQLDELRTVTRRQQIRSLIRPSEAGRLVHQIQAHAELVAQLPRLRRSDSDRPRVPRQAHRLGAGRWPRNGVAFSKASAMRNRVGSWNGLPTSWIATGNPPEPNPAHTEIAG